MQWKDVKLDISKQHAEAAQAIALSIASAGIYIEDYSDIETAVLEMAHTDLIEPDLLQRDRALVAVHLYFDADADTQELLALLEARLKAANIPYALAHSDVEQQQWESAWKNYYHAFDVCGRLTVAPSWEAQDPAFAPEPGRAVLKLDPGMAFGTGTHETTLLCLERLCERVRGGEKLLDVGTGSGILAIAALLLGAQQADGIDIDPIAVRTALENAQLNGVESRFTCRVADLAQQASGTYDIIVANIISSSVIALAPQIKPLLKKGGVFIASGIIDDYEQDVTTAITQCGFTAVRVYRKNGWVAVEAGK